MSPPRPSADIPPTTVRPLASCLYEPKRQVYGEAGVPSRRLNSHYHVIRGKVSFCTGAVKL